MPLKVELARLLLGKDVLDELLHECALAVLARKQTPARRLPVMVELAKLMQGMDVPDGSSHNSELARLARTQTLARCLQMEL